MTRKKYKSAKVATDSWHDRNVFVLTPAEFNEFEKTLRTAPKSSNLVRALKKRPSPWK
jgi:hypothetical protein